MHDGPPEGDPRTDEALIAAIQSRDDVALAALYDRYGRMAFGLAYRILGERGVAEDVVQEAFLAVWRRASGFSPERGAARSWLMAIVHNLSIDRRRGRFRHEQTDVQLDDVDYRLEGSSEDVFGAVAGSIEAEHIRSVMLDLPDEQRQAIELAFFMGLSHQEIATRTGMPLGTVKGRMRLGLRKMRSALAEWVELDAPRPDDRPASGGQRR
ncbi:MAG TPA: sigma-70 family RNA polymerase sigma factor [Thermomicrobiales bacterium]|jgi:RNA polymerase sigma-70 factor (ECF subfamily)|nr:sigma-70 family RNA polymerase sigma factor [Thermomicrobiales bacterium]